MQIRASLLEHLWVVINNEKLFLGLHCSFDTELGVSISNLFFINGPFVPTM